MGILKEVLLLPVAPIRYPYKLIKLGSKGIKRTYNWNKDRVDQRNLEDLILIGMDFAEDEISLYETKIKDIESEIEKSKEKINKHFKDAEALDKKILEGEAALEKMKKQKNIIGAVTIKAGKKYRTQKNLIDKYKADKKEYPNIIKQESENLKSKQLELKRTRKELQKFKNNLRKEVESHKDVIKVVKYFYKNKGKFIERCHPDVVASIESEMQEIRDNEGNWTFIATPQEYLQSLKESIKIKGKENLEEEIDQTQNEPDVEKNQQKQEQSKTTQRSPRAQTTARTKIETDKDWQDFFRDEGTFSQDAFKEIEKQEESKVEEPKAEEPKAEELRVESTKHYDKKIIKKLNDYMGEDVLEEGDIANLNSEQEYEGTIDDIIAEVKGETKIPTLEEQLAVAKEKFEKRDKKQSSKGGKHLTSEEKIKEAKREEQNAKRREKRAEAKRIKQVNIQSLLENRAQLIEAIKSERTASIKSEFIKELRDIEGRIEEYGVKVEPYIENTSTIIDKRGEPYVENTNIFILEKRKTFIDQLRKGAEAGAPNPNEEKLGAEVKTNMSQEAKNTEQDSLENIDGPDGDER